MKTGGKIDVLFVHEGKEVEPKTKIYLVPMGLLSIADWLAKNGYNTLILHHAIEKSLDRAFDISGFVKLSGARVVCLDLHWHQQASSVIDLAGKIKRNSDVTVVLGGYTASAFDREILQKFKFIDFIIRGDGEIPMLELAERLRTGRDVAPVPNLTYRRSSRIMKSRALHVNSKEDLARFSFTNFKLIRNHRYYNQRGLMEGVINTTGGLEPGIFYCNSGRGCPYNCLFCGGSKKAQLLTGGRRNVVFRPLPSMLRDLEGMKDHNLDTWYNTFNPGEDESYFLKLFREIRKRKIRINMVQECLHIPSKKYVAEFSRTFGAKSRLDFVLLTGSESLRRKNRGNYFSNSSLLDCLDLLAGHGVKAQLGFLTGLPFEKMDDIQASFELILLMKSRFGDPGVNAEILAIEPCAPMNLAPERFGIVSHARSFMDYYRGHKRPHFTGYVPGNFTVRESELIAGYFRLAGRCPVSGGGFARALLKDPALMRRLPAAQWKTLCGGCSDSERCFSSRPFLDPAAEKKEKKTEGKKKITPGKKPAGRRLIQLHTVNLWDGGQRYGLGAPSLISYARSLPDIKKDYDFDQVVWKSQVPGGHEPQSGEIASKVLDEKPFLAGFTIVSWSEKIFFDAIRRIKKEKPEIHIAVGGPLASACGPRLMKDIPEVDFLVCGYGELPFVSLLRYFTATETRAGKRHSAGFARGLYHRLNGKAQGKKQTLRDVISPDGIPSPFRAALVNISGCPTMHVEWSRGCPGRCAYCSWGNETRAVIQSSEARIIDDTAWAREHEVKDITLNNSAVNFETEKLRRLCRAMIEGDPGRGIEFTAFIRYEYLDEEQIEILREVNFKSLIIGLQTDDDDELQVIGRPAFNRRKFEWALSRFAAFTRPGVQIITAIPGDTFEKFSRRLDYLLNLDCDITVFPLQVTPGTRMWKERGDMGISPDREHNCWVYETPSLSAGEHLDCIERAAVRLEETSSLGGEKRESHGVSTGPEFYEKIQARANEGKVIVQLHDANVYDGGMHFSLGVPFLIAHSRGMPEINRAVRLKHISWSLERPGCANPTKEEIISRIMQEPPHIAGFSLHPWCYELFLDVIRDLKRAAPGVKIIVGGSNAILLKKELMREVEEIDFLAAGEGELPFSRLLAALTPGGPDTDRRQYGKSGGLFYRKDGRISGRAKIDIPRGDLDYCGAPSREGLIALHPKDGNLYFEWTRGCPNQCSYCSWPRDRHELRRFSKGRIIQDIQWARQRGFETIFICDSSVNYSNKLLGDLCETLVEADPERKIAFSAFVQYYLLTKKQVDIMKPVRWSRIMTGLQTDDARGLKVLGRPAFDRVRFEESIELLRSLKTPYVEIMTGVPGDTAGKLMRRLDYLLSLECRVSMFPLLATPGTKIWEMRKRLGLTLDPKHQFVIREIPTMSHDDYSKAIDYAFSLNRPKEELEIVGYEFLGYKKGGAVSAGARGEGKKVGKFDAGEFRRTVDSLTERFRHPGEKTKLRRGKALSFKIKDIKEIRAADISGMRLTFIHGKNRISIDVFRSGDISMPVARGRDLSFCSSVWQDGDISVGVGGNGDTARALCMILAEIDRRT